MGNFQIQTAQNVSIDQNTAHLSSRIGSFLIDLIIILMYNFSVIIFFQRIHLPANFSDLIVYLIAILPSIFYTLMAEIAMNGQTPGKFFNQIRVVKIDGTKPTLANHISRWILRIIDLWSFGGSVAIFTTLFSEKGQRLGDIVAGTTVISEKKRLSLKDTLIHDLEDNYIPIYPQVTVLSDKDMQIIRELFTVAKRKKDAILILKLYEKVIDITSIETELKAIDFLELVIKDYHYYTSKA